VVGANTGTNVRQAGALSTGVAPYENWKGHTMGFTGTPPGGTTPVTNFACADCHRAHGSTNYRNLDTPITYALGTNDTTKDVFVRSWTLGAVSTNYAASTVDFNEPVATRSAMGEFCKSCHTNFHGASTDPNMKTGATWLRHPTADSNIGNTAMVSLTQFSAKLYRVKVMSPTGNWGTQGTAWATAPADTTPTCISCHKAHGNKNPFGLIYATGTAAITEEGDGTGMRTLCGQCHTQGN
jgi:predicted CXXCH cytochrome family protein